MALWLIILGLIAAGIAITSIIALSVVWIVKKIKEKKTLGNVKKVMVADIRNMAENCDNTVSLKDLDDLVNSGYTHVMADIDENGNVVNKVEVIKDTNKNLDLEVEKLLGKKGMVVVEV